MKIVQATMEDLEGVSNLFNLYRMFYQQESDLGGAKTYIKERIESKDSVIFVVKDQTKLCRIHATLSNFFVYIYAKSLDFK